MSWARVWAGLTQEERHAAVLAHPIAGPRPLPDASGVALELAGLLHMRERSVAQMPSEKRIALLVKSARLSEHAANSLLVRWHFGPRRPLMVRFFDACQVKHDDGQLDVEVSGAALPAARLAEGLRALQDAPPREVDVLLDCLEATGLRVWAELAQARAAHAAAPAAPPDPPADTPAPPPVGERAVRGFTTLDLVLIDAAVASAAEQVGALAPEQVHDLVSEVVELNAKRTRSWFHLGFLDALHGRPASPGGAEANVERLRWYLAGAISALARRGLHAEIVARVRAQPEIASGLVAEDSPTLALVAGLLFAAHESQAALGELVRMVTPRAVGAAGMRLAGPMLRAATTLLREHKAAEAWPLLDRLYGALRFWGADEDQPPAGFLADLERRRAHALRLRGDMDGAKAILKELLARGAGMHASRAHADLGLIASGHKALVYVDVPLQEADWPEKARALRRGLGHFQASVEQPEPGGAHGDYCLGVLYVCERDYARARPHLERAVAEMQADEAVYAPLGTLDRARLYLGVCLADTLDLARAGQTAELLEQGVRGLKGNVPTRLLLDAFAHLGTTDPERVVALTERLRGPLGDRLLAAAQAAETLHAHPELLARLVERMQDETRPRRERIEDAEAALAAALRARSPDAGAQALDVLEVLSDDRKARQRLLALLEDRERYDPAWSLVEARMVRVRLLEADARYDEARALLEEAAHEALAQEGERAAPQVQGLIERIDDHGRGGASPELVRRLQALRPVGSAAPTPARRASPRGRILFLGGDERQRQYDERLTAELRAAYPDVTLDLEHTGWSSNWGRGLTQLSNRIREADAVVLMQFMRTLLGRHVREMCGQHGKPWHACTGHGYASVKRSIEQAAERLAPGA